MQYSPTSHPHAACNAVAIDDACPAGSVCDFDQCTGRTENNAYGYDENGNTLAPGAHLPRVQVPGSAFLNANVPQNLTCLRYCGKRPICLAA